MIMKDVFELFNNGMYLSPEPFFDVNFKDPLGNTMLHIAAYWNDCEIVRILIESGAEIDAVGEDGETPLHRAAMSNSVDSAKLLRSYGAKSLKDEDGLTPYELAKVLGKVDVLSVLND